MLLTKPPKPGVGLTILTQWVATKGALYGPTKSEMAEL